MALAMGKVRAMNVLILGPAKTGTTVVSEAIARAIGADRYVSEPKTFEELDVAGLSKAGSVVLKMIFEHWRHQPNLRRGVVRNETALKFDRRVFTMRDPRDELLSRLHFLIKPRLDSGSLADDQLRQWVDVFRRKEAEPGKLSVRQMVEACERILGSDSLDDVAITRRWHQFVVKEMTEGRFVLAYEQFVAGEIGPLCTYLGVEGLEREFPSRFEHRRRTGGSGDWKRYFTPSDVDFYRRRLGTLMAELGYTDWELDPVATLPAETGSGYVEMLIAKAAEGRQGRSGWRLGGLLGGGMRRMTR